MIVSHDPNSHHIAFINGMNNSILLITSGITVITFRKEIKVKPHFAYGMGVTLLILGVFVSLQVCKQFSSYVNFVENSNNSELRDATNPMINHWKKWLRLAYALTLFSSVFVFFTTINFISEL